MERNGHTGSWWLSSLGDRTTADSRGGDNGICHLDIRDENGDCTFHWHRLNGLVDQRRDCRGSVGILLIEFADGLERSRGLYENIDFRGKNTSLCRLHLLQFLNGGRGSVHHFRLVGVVLSYTAAFNLVKVVPIVNTPKMKLGLKTYFSQQVHPFFTSWKIGGPTWWRQQPSTFSSGLYLNANGE